MGQGLVLGDLHKVHLVLVGDIQDNLMDVLEVLVLHNCCRKMDHLDLVGDLQGDRVVVQV